MQISIILPTLNERENVERLVPDLLAGISGVCEILVVDDASTDGTPEAVERLAAADPRVRLLCRPGPPGLTASLRDGIAATRGELVGWMDADLLISTADYDQIVQTARAGADLAIASRFVPGGRIKGQTRAGLVGQLEAFTDLNTSEDSWLGVFLSVALNVALLPLLTGQGVHDYTSGVIAARRSALAELPVAGDHGEYFIGMLVAALRRGMRVEEIGYRCLPRQHGTSKTGNNLWDYARRGRRYVTAGLAARLAR